MHVIPVINCQNFADVQSRLKIAQEILALVPVADRWVHIDIADGGFTGGYTTWRNPTELAELKLSSDIKIELHLMVNEPEQSMDVWLAVGIARLIFHLETTASVEVITAVCHNRGVEPMLALAPVTPVAHALPYLAGVSAAQILTVTPGPAGSPFDPKMLEKIKQLRDRFPNMIIEVDGGVNPETTKQMKAAGATQVCAGSYIFNNADPAKAFKELLDA